MPFRIQRVPRGLSDLLSIFGGQSPTELEDRSRLTLESLQFYGTTQLQSGFGNQAAAAEGTSAQFILDATKWTVLFAAWGAIARTATMTALEAEVNLCRNTLYRPVLFAKEWTTFGATVTGTGPFGGYLPYPLLCPPGSFLSCTPRIIGTDATCNVSVYGEYGTLG